MTLLAVFLPTARDAWGRDPDNGTPGQPEFDNFFIQSEIFTRPDGTASPGFIVKSETQDPIKAADKVFILSYQNVNRL